MPFSFVLPLLRLESRKYLCAHDEQAETLRSPNVWDYLWGAGKSLLRAI